jgi:hypothetical protein
VTALVNEHCPYPDHDLLVDVDDHGYAFESCRRDDGSFHGDALVYGRVNPRAARMIRASARWYLSRMARKFGDARRRNMDTVVSSTPTGLDSRPGPSALSGDGAPSSPVVR